ncbi:MAG TPA: DUF5335 family protein [Terriglobales bacterium]|nr:DUF5335 family protein [Terriglobales bacterium]
MDVTRETAPEPGRQRNGQQIVTREVPRREWPAFFDMFGRQHQSWLVTVELFGPEIGAQVEVRDRPLGGITAELGHGRDDSIVLFLGAMPSELTHIVNRPTHVWLKQTTAGVDQAVAIERDGGPTTLLRLRSPMLLEMVDDFVVWGR